MERTYQIAALYQFGELPFASLQGWAERLEAFGRERGVIGLLLVATEGLNGTVAAEEQALAAFLDEVFKVIPVERPTIKYSEAPRAPFPRLKVRVRDEIVTFERELPRPHVSDSTHLSPEEWHRTLMSDEDFVLLDTRNYYETQVGIFKGAIDPNIESFTDLVTYLNEAGIPKDKKVLMYCTGGIRCEKASLEMKAQGYEEVYQLDGGILNYLAEYPDGAFEGECFVFDRRVAVDQKLQPSKRYHLCPHCGDPGDLITTCPKCGGVSKVCTSCTDADSVHHACSKDCAYHLRLHPEKFVSTAT